MAPRSSSFLRERGAQYASCASRRRRDSPSAHRSFQEDRREAGARNKSSSSRVRCTGFPQRRMRSRFRMERERSLQWGFNDQIDTSPILFKKVRLQGSGVGAVQIAEAMARTIAALKLKSVIAEIFGFEQAKDALVKLQDSKGRESGPVQSSCLRAVEARRVLHHRRPRRRRSGHE